MKKHLKNRQGFTLIELVVVLAITSIVLVAIGGIMVFGNNIVKNTNYKFDEHTMALLLEQKIKNTVQNSTSLTIYSDSTATTLNTCKSTYNSYVYFGTNLPGGSAVNSGLVISYNGSVSVFQQGRFTYYPVTVSFKETSAAVLHVTISIYNNANANDNYTLNTDIPINNIGRGFTSASITDNTGGNPNGGALIGFTPYTSP